jgi:hypothetical protein
MTKKRKKLLPVTDENKIKKFYDLYVELLTEDLDNKCHFIGYQYIWEYENYTQKPLLESVNYSYSFELVKRNIEKLPIMDINTNCRRGSRVNKNTHTSITISCYVKDIETIKKKWKLMAMMLRGCMMKMYMMGL